MSPGPPPVATRKPARASRHPSSATIAYCGSSRGVEWLPITPTTFGAMPPLPSSHAVLLTHAHLDHCGLIPHLAASGFRKPIYATKGSVDLTRLVLLDSAKLQEEFAQSHQRFAKRNPDRAAAEDEATMAELAAATTKDPAAATRDAAPAATTELRAPLYTVDDANAALALFHGIDYGTELQVAPGITATSVAAAHILGSAIIRVRVMEGDTERTIVFSGDLGRPGSPIIRDPTPVTSADYLLIESTYGGKTHEPQEG